MVGRLAIAPLQDLQVSDSGHSDQVLSSPLLLPLLPRRSFEYHKGQAGRVGIVAGQGAGVLGEARLARMQQLEVLNLRYSGLMQGVFTPGKLFSAGGVLPELGRGRLVGRQLAEVRDDLQLAGTD